jgi:hypothetical protein
LLQPGEIVDPHIALTVLVISFIAGTACVLAFFAAVALLPAPVPIVFLYPSNSLRLTAATESVSFFIALKVVLQDAKKKKLKLFQYLRDVRIFYAHQQREQGLRDGEKLKEDSRGIRWRLLFFWRMGQRCLELALQVSLSR